MPQNIFDPSWSNKDANEILYILLEVIGRPGQYEDLAKPSVFSLPLAGAECQIVLTFSETSEIKSIEPGPKFNANRWAQVKHEVEGNQLIKVGRDISFSGYRVQGYWRGQHSGIQILPPPAGAPLAPVEIAAHPFILEFPVKASDNWPITNFRRQREHLLCTSLLNVLLSGGATKQPRRSRHFWAAIKNEDQPEPKIQWVQGFYFAAFGAAIEEKLSPPTAQSIEEVPPEQYYAQVGHIGGPLRVPTDLDESICRLPQLTKELYERCERAVFWMDMASGQHSSSFSAVFAHLCVAIEALIGGDHSKRTAKFREFIERYAPGASLKERRDSMYALRSAILHGSRIMQMDQVGYFGWSPPGADEEELMRELWGLARIVVRNWLKDPH